MIAYQCGDRLPLRQPLSPARRQTVAWPGKGILLPGVIVSIFYGMILQPDNLFQINALRLGRFCSLIIVETAERRLAYCHRIILIADFVAIIDLSNAVEIEMLVEIALGAVV